ncbi:hypothetical protein XELAEV_18012315mg [Xenopus laevis]|uniref:Uncharacterized protein n=1 Tax=Xenopus laevis TaxID=8355 RepID=A0A974DPA2_XENLA|nr:hypothetical protein XELAEV_18012315mg [Xenopus laevis]
MKNIPLIFLLKFEKIIIQGERGELFHMTVFLVLLSSLKEGLILNQTGGGLQCLPGESVNPAVSEFCDAAFLPTGTVNPEGNCHLAISIY